MSIKIKYIGHSGFIISGIDSNVLIDPFITGCPTAECNIKKENIDDILVTHGHSDHLGDSIDISRTKKIYITCIFELANYCNHKGGNAKGINKGGKIKFKWGWAKWLNASHSSSTPEGLYCGDPASILLEIDGVKIYHAGDTGLHMDMKMIGEIYKPDISLLPIGGYYTMDTDDAVVAANWLGSKIVVPMHYNTFPPIAVDVNLFKAKLESESSINCIILNPGENYTV